MSKIQSAEELVGKITKMQLDDAGEFILNLSTEDAIALVRSRDRAIVERCKEAVKNTVSQGVLGAESAWAWVVCRNVSEKALDSVLRELEGEEGKA